MLNSLVNDTESPPPRLADLPLISVLMPSLNYSHTLDEAIESFIGQTYPNKELIIVDDGSTDDSWRKIGGWERKYPDKIRALKHASRSREGLAKSYQLALANSAGKWIAFLEADDVWYSGHLAQRAMALEQYPEVAVVYSDYRPFGDASGTAYWQIYRLSNKFRLKARQPVDSSTTLLKRNPMVSFSNLLTRRELLTDVPPPPDNEIFYDWWVLAHLTLKHKICYLPDRSWSWRIHKKSANYNRFNFDQLRQLQAFLLRLYDSLLKQPGISPQALAKVRIEKDKMLLYKELTGNSGLLTKITALTADPLQTIRFIFHILLKNMLFWPAHEK